MRFWLIFKKRSDDWQQEGGLKLGSNYQLTEGQRCMLPGTRWGNLHKEASSRDNLPVSQDPTVRGCGLFHREDMLQI